MAERLDKPIGRPEREERYNKPLPSELEELRWKLMIDIRNELAELHKQLVSDVVEHSNRDRTTFCPNCGTVFTPAHLPHLLAIVPKVECPRCKLILPSAYEACPNCGNILNKEPDE